jgi:hypothetical protein
LGESPALSVVRGKTVVPATAIRAILVFVAVVVQGRPGKSANLIHRDFSIIRENSSNNSARASPLHVTYSANILKKICSVLNLTNDCSCDLIMETSGLFSATIAFLLTLSIHFWSFITFLVVRILLAFEKYRSSRTHFLSVSFLCALPAVLRNKQNISKID